MKRLKPVSLVCIAIAFALSLFAEQQPTKEDAALIAKIKENLNGQTGRVGLPGNFAELNLIDGYTYLAPEKAKFLIEELWGNPPGYDGLGVILPPGFQLRGPGPTWAIDLAYEDTGHVKDDDAAKMDYSKILSQMRKDIGTANAERKKKGYDEISLKGWAALPHYDAESKKMYWAKELAFGKRTVSTLNYNIRVLGRQGTLILNVVADIDDLRTVEAATPKILSQADFVAGQKYADFKPATDHAAEFGVAGLILGGVAVKAGLLKVLIGALAAGWKLIVVFIGGVGAFFAKRLKGKDRSEKPLTRSVTEDEDAGREC